MIKVESKAEIIALLYEFDNVFVHNREKISDYGMYANKLLVSGNVFKLIVQDKIAGVCAFYNNDIINGVGYISLIGLKKEYQHIGIGTAFLNSIIAFLKNSGMKIVRLEVDKDNDVAFNFYLRNSFIVLEEKENCLLLERII